MTMTGNHHIGAACASVKQTVRCEHQVEIELWPPNAEAYFANERYADPATAQVRFDATVYNAPTSRIRWDVRDASGNLGKGTIDNTGVYHAPPKTAGMDSGMTEIVCATAVDDPLRKAFAYVTIVGRGPAPAPIPTILILPKTTEVFYPGTEYHNEYMDPSKTVQRFEAIITKTTDRQVIWKFNTVEQVGHTLPWINYRAIGPGGTAFVKVTATLKNHPSVHDEAELVVTNYVWPGKTS